MEALLSLPPSALRLEMNVADRLHKLGLHQIRNFISMPRSALRRRFGREFILKLDQALGNEEEAIIPVEPIEPWRERLPCLEPIVTATGIEIALQLLLDTICQRLQQEGMGIRKAVFTGFRTDGKMEKIEIGTHRATLNAKHLYKLFEDKISTIEPAPGIEFFMIEALKTEKISPHQEKLWDTTSGLEDPGLSELMDRLANRFGNSPINRFLPAEHYLPEKSFKESVSPDETSGTPWMTGRPRPMQLLSRPERIEVTAPIPDYPPMIFRYQGKLHKIKKADGPERIEQEWWIQDGPHRDYYAVEDEEGQRYWLFRSGIMRKTKNRNGLFMDFLPKYMKYTELQFTTNFSFLRGASHPEEFVEQAAAYGYTCHRHYRPEQSGWHRACPCSCQIHQVSSFFRPAGWTCWMGLACWLIRLTSPDIRNYPVS